MLRVAKVSFHAHRAEQEETDPDRGRRLETVRQRPRVALARLRHGSSGGTPGELGGLARRITHGEADTLIGRIGPQVDHPSGALQVDLEGVAARILVHAGLVAFIRGWVVEPRLREREVGGHRVASQRDREEHREERHARRESYAPQGRCATLAPS